MMAHSRAEKSRLLPLTPMLYDPVSKNLEDQRQVRPRWVYMLSEVHMVAVEKCQSFSSSPLYYVYVVKGPLRRQCCLDVILDMKR